MDNKVYVRLTWFTQIGTILAVSLSYAVNKSIWWVMLHGFFGWFYCVYWGFKYGILNEVINVYLMR